MSQLRQRLPIRTGRLLAVWLALCATSPPLPDAKALSGKWALAEQGSGQSCTLEFTLRPVENGHAIESGSKCLSELRLGGAVSWRPAPDGIAIASASGRTLAFFFRKGAAYVLRREGCLPLRLTKVRQR